MDDYCAKEDDEDALALMLPRVEESVGCQLSQVRLSKEILHCLVVELVEERMEFH